MRPDHAGDGVGIMGEERMLNQTQMLALVGSRALEWIMLPAERTDILEAAKDERYSLFVSAFDQATYMQRMAKLLLWRTQMSVPVVGLSLERAVPMLSAAGAALFGRETRTPRRITIDVAGVLRRREPEKDAPQPVSR